MVRLNFVRFTPLLIVLWVGGFSCGLKTGYEDAMKAQEAIKSELGAESRVNFRTFSSTNGTHTSVTVTVRELPAGDAREFKAKVTEVVRRNFRSKVDRVDLVF